MKNLRAGIASLKKVFSDRSMIHPDKAFQESGKIPLLVGACKYDFAVMVTGATKDVDAVKDKWLSLVKKCVDALEESSLPGWEIKKNEVASDLDLATSLVCNPKYSALHENNELLNAILPKIKSVSQDGAGLMFEAEFIEKAESVQRHSTLTVLHSYVLMQLLDTIPSMKSPAARQKAVQMLREEVGVKMFDGKKSPLSQSLLERARSLAQGVEFERFDFTAKLASSKLDAASVASAELASGASL